MAEASGSGTPRRGQQLLLLGANPAQPLLLEGAPGPLAQASPTAKRRKEAPCPEAALALLGADPSP